MKDLRLADRPFKKEPNMVVWFVAAALAVALVAFWVGLGIVEYNREHFPHRRPALDHVSLLLIDGQTRLSEVLAAWGKPEYTVTYETDHIGVVQQPLGSTVHVKAMVWNRNGRRRTLHFVGDMLAKQD